MKNLKAIIFNIFLLMSYVHGRNLDSLDYIRTAMMVSEVNSIEGGHLILDSKEQHVDDIIRVLKTEEINMGFKNGSNYAPAMHFFRAKSLIEQSKVFDAIKMVPKGAVLHVHNTASVSVEWIIQNLTYREEAEYCTSKFNIILFTAGDHTHCKDTPINMMEHRKNLSSEKAIHEFDAWLETQINLYTSQPELDYPDINTVWNKFQVMFSTVKGLLSFLPFFKDYHYRMLEEFYDDGIYYTEIRTGFGTAYDNKGNGYDIIACAGIMQDVARQFGMTHPDFIGLKAIFSGSRRSNTESLQEKVTTYIQLKLKYPSFIIGFDFVGQEDVGTPLAELKSVIDSLPTGTNFFFHAGETNWWGTYVDMNVIDAILFNATRIGHGYALLKHPTVWNSVLLKEIAIEVSVISNQVLHLVQDLRNHPAAVYIALNLPIVITNDDPSFWGAKGLSYDWYLAYMAISPAHAGLRLLKQLALNAIKYSILTHEERLRYDVIFQRRWNQFLDYVIMAYGNKVLRTI